MIISPSDSIFGKSRETFESSLRSVTRRLGCLHRNHALPGWTEIWTPVINDLRCSYDSWCNPDAESEFENAKSVFHHLNLICLTVWCNYDSFTVIKWIFVRFRPTHSDVFRNEHQLKLHLKSEAGIRFTMSKIFF